MLIGFKDNKYHRIILKFNTSYNSYTCRIIEDISSPIINFVTLDSGIVLLINDDNLELFSKDPAKENIKSFTDPDINITMKLCKDGTSVMFFKGTKLYKIKVK